MAVAFNENNTLERWLPVVAVGALAAYAITRGIGHRAGRRGTGVITHHDSHTRRQLSGSRGIHVEHAVLIAKPAAPLYRFWRNLENLPKFMHHLESVTMRDEGVSHWVAKGPGGMSVKWDARIINEIDSKIIAWQSITGSMVATAGSVNFDETDRGTVVRVHMQYNPPGGRIGAALAYVFGEEPRLQVESDLRRFKQLMETGEIPTIDGQPSGRRSLGSRR